MTDFKCLNNAKKVLELENKVTLEEIKFNYRKLSNKYHPDKCKGRDKSNCEKKFKEINDAYQIVMEYIRNYRYSFDREDLQKSKKEEIYEEHINRFYDGWWERFI